MKNFAFYLINDEEVVLLYRHEVEQLDSTLLPLQDEGSMCAYLLTDVVKKWIEDNRINVCSTIDDCYTREWNGPVEIVNTEVINPENEQKIICAWVTSDYAESDRAERQLCVTTNGYYDWTSTRTKILEKLCDKDANLKELEQEWMEEVSQFSEQALRDLDVSWKGLLNEANKIFN